MTLQHKNAYIIRTGGVANLVARNTPNTSAAASVRPLLGILQLRHEAVRTEQPDLLGQVHSITASCLGGPGFGLRQTAPLVLPDRSLPGFLRSLPYMTGAVPSMYPRQLHFTSCSCHFTTLITVLN
jgi:hypothetical protein